MPQFRDQILVFKKHAHFRIQGYGPRIEVEGSDETDPVIDAERLCVQAGALGSKYRNLGPPAKGLKLEKLHAVSQQALAIVGVCAVDRGDVGRG